MEEKLVDANKKNVIELPFAIVKLRADGIIHMHFKEDVDVTLEELMQVNAAVKQLGGDKKYPNLITMGKYTSITREAREYMTTEECNCQTLADAFVLVSFHQRLLASYFLRFNKPSNPIRLFVDEASAVTWLTTFITS